MRQTREECEKLEHNILIAISEGRSLFGDIWQRVAPCYEERISSALQRLRKAGRIITDGKQHWSISPTRRKR